MFKRKRPDDPSSVEEQLFILKSNFLKSMDDNHHACLEILNEMENYANTYMSADEAKHYTNAIAEAKNDNLDELEALVDGESDDDSETDEDAMNVVKSHDRLIDLFDQLIDLKETRTSLSRDFERESNKLAMSYRRIKK